jgi:Bacteriophage lambda head decoration protein D
MTTLTQGIQPFEFLLSEADGMRARDQVTVTVAGAVALPSGTVLGKITATGKYIKYLDGASDGSQVAAAVLGTPLDGVNGDYKCLAFTRDCEVIGNRLNGGSNVDANGNADLKALGIIVR